MQLRKVESFSWSFLQSSLLASHPGFCKFGIALVMEGDQDACLCFDDDRHGGLQLYTTLHHGIQ